MSGLLFDLGASSSTSDIGDHFAAIQTHKIYSERKLSDPFHKLAEMCMERWARNNKTNKNLHLDGNF